MNFILQFIRISSVYYFCVFVTYKILIFIIYENSYSSFDLYYDLSRSQVSAVLGISFFQESKIYTGIHCHSPSIYYHGSCAICYELQQENGPSTYIAILVKYKRKIELSNHKVWKCGNNFTLRNSMSGFCIEVFKTRGIPHPEITGILSLSRYHSPSTLCCTVRRQIQKYKNTKMQKYKNTKIQIHFLE